MVNKVSVMTPGKALTVASLSAHASTEVRSVSGVIGQDSLDSQTAALHNMADAAGASGFYITSAGGKNKLHDSALLLR